MSARLGRGDARVVFAIAIVLRLVHAGIVARTPFFEGTVVDERGFHRWALEILGGDALGRSRPVFFQPPLYPYALAAFYRLAGPEPAAARVAQGLLGSLLAPAVLVLARRISASRAAGLVAGVFAAIYGPILFEETRLSKESLAVPLAGGLLLLLSPLRAGPFRTALAGFALGFLCLLRENALVLAPVLAAAVACVRGRRGARLAAFVGGLALPLLPCAVHNAAIGRDFVLTTYQGGVNFWIGSGPGATGFYRPLLSGRQTPDLEEKDSVVVAEREAGRALRPSQVSAWWFSRTVEAVLAEPSASARLLLRKVAILSHHGEPADTVDYETFREDDPLLSPSRLSFGLLLPLAAAGFASLSPRRRVRARTIVLYAVGTTLSLLPFFVFGRYRLALVPALLPAAGAGAVALARAAVEAFRAAGGAKPLPGRGRPVEQTPSGVLLAVALAAAAAHRPVSSADRSGFAATTHWNRALLLLEGGHESEARRFLDRALELRPGHPKASRALSDLEIRSGRAGEAVAILESAVRLAPADASLQSALGIARKFAGELDGAATALREAIRLDPAESALAHAHLGDALRLAGRRADARVELEEALRRRPYLVDAYLLLAHLDRDEGRAEEAAATLRRALSLPGLPDAERRRLLEALARGPNDAAATEDARPLPPAGVGPGGHSSGT